MRKDMIDYIALVAKMIEADPDAVGQFILYFSDLLRREFLTRRIPASIAEDLAVECTEKLARRIPQYDPARGTLQAWVRASGMNALRDWIRTYQASRETTYLDELPRQAVYTKFHSDDAMALVVQQALLHLSNTDQKIIDMKFREGCTHAQIAEALGMSHDNVRKHYERALARLKTLLKQEERVQARLCRSLVRTHP